MKSQLIFQRVLKWIVFFLLMAIILVSGIILRNFLLKQLQAKLSSYFTYSQVKFNFWPSRLIFEDINLTAENPFFTARRLMIETKLFPFIRRRPIKIIIEEPVIHYRVAEETKEGQPIFKLPSALLFEQVLLRKAELSFETGNQSFWASDLKALWKRRGDGFELEAEASNSSLTLSAKQIMSSAKLKLAIGGRKQELKVSRFLMFEADRYLQLKGSIKNLSDPEINLDGIFWFPMEAIDAWLKLPFDWQGRVTSRGQITRRLGRWYYQGEIGSSDLQLNELPLGKARGWLETTLGIRGDLSLEFQRQGENQEFSISWERGKIAGRYAHFYLDPVLKGLKLPWPVKSPSWGKFYLANRELTVEGELREKEFLIEGLRYPFQGYYRVVWDTQKKVAISAREFLSSFARFNLEARIDLGQNLEVEIASEVADVATTRLFLQDLLQKKWNFPAIRGQAEARVNIGGHPSSPDIEVKFSGSPFSFGRFEVKEASGQFQIRSGRFEGHFTFKDPDLTGETELKIDSSGLSTFLAIKNGDWSKALSGLDLKFPLKGKFEGPFRLTIDPQGKYKVNGEFLSPEMTFLGQSISQASGQIFYADRAFNLRGFKGELARGKIAGELNLDLSREMYSVDFSGQGLQLNQLVSGFKGQLVFNLKGGGILGQDKVKGNFEIEDLAISLYKKPLLKGLADILISRQGLEAKLLPLDQKEDNFEIHIFSSFSQPQYSIQGKGQDNLLTIIPWKGTSGSLNYLFEVKKEKGKREITGVLEAAGEILPFPHFPHPLTDFSLLVFLHNQSFSIRSFRGKLGGGELNGFGEIKLIPGGELNADLQLDGHDMVLSPFDRTRFLTDASLRLVKNKERYALEGLFSVKKAFWRREFFEKLGFSTYQKRKDWPSILEGLTISLRLKADDQAWVENSLARIRGRFDLILTGEIKAPLLLGEMEALDGSIFFQERNFRLLKGRLVLANPAISVPYLEMMGETYVQDYRVSFSLSGPIDRLKPEFSSSPPLASEEILALLALGESFKRITSTDVVAQVSTGSFLSGEIIEEAKRRAQRILSLDHLRIDPFVLGSSAEMTARLTVGKKISENFFIIYSTNLTTQREEIVRIEWELKPGLSLVGIRNELGRLSFDLKIRRRF